MPSCFHQEDGYQPGEKQSTAAWLRNAQDRPAQYGSRVPCEPQLSKPGKQIGKHSGRRREQTLILQPLHEVTPLTNRDMDRNSGTERKAERARRRDNEGSEAVARVRINHIYDKLTTARVNRKGTETTIDPGTENLLAQIKPKRALRSGTDDAAHAQHNGERDELERCSFHKRTKLTFASGRAGRVRPARHKTAVPPLPAPRLLARAFIDCKVCITGEAPRKLLGRAPTPSATSTEAANPNATPRAEPQPD